MTDSLTVPGPTLGVVGGGQLGRMLAEAAAPLGVETVVLDPTPDCPAAPVVRDQIVGPFDDPAAVRRLAERADVLTFEIELADPDLLDDVADEFGVPVHPSPDTLRVIQDKLVQKRHLQDHDIPVAPFRPVSTLGDLRDGLAEFGYPAMLKARTGGYDGRGNFRIDDESDVEPAFEAAPGEMLLEAFVPFERELSVIGVKGADEVATFPVGENVHEDEILRETVVPARTSDDVLDRAQAVARKVLSVMEGRGVYGIELFETSEPLRGSENASGGEPRAENGEILVNEIAPRPHNSGHYTIEGAFTSQFEQHTRAVLGLPLGSTELRRPTVMANVLGDVSESRPLASETRATGPGGSPDESAVLSGVPAVLSEPGVSFHWYGKREVRPLRKMGHLTAVGSESRPVDDLLATARTLRDSLTFQ